MEDILNEPVEESTKMLPSMIEGEDIENYMNSNKIDPLRFCTVVRSLVRSSNMYLFIIIYLSLN